MREIIKEGLDVLRTIGMALSITGAIAVGFTIGYNLNEQKSYHTEFRYVELAGDPRKPERIGIVKDQEGKIVKIYLDELDSNIKEKYVDGRVR